MNIQVIRILYVNIITTLLLIHDFLLESIRIDFTKLNINDSKGNCFVDFYFLFVKLIIYIIIRISKLKKQQMKLMTYTTSMKEQIHLTKSYLPHHPLAFFHILHILRQFTQVDC